MCRPESKAEVFWVRSLVVRDGGPAWFPTLRRRRILFAPRPEAVDEGHVEFGVVDPMSPPPPPMNRYGPRLEFVLRDAGPEEPSHIRYRWELEFAIPAEIIWMPVEEEPFEDFEEPEPPRRRRPGRRRRRREAEAQRLADFRALFADMRLPNRFAPVEEPIVPAAQEEEPVVQAAREEERVVQAVPGEERIVQAAQEEERVAEGAAARPGNVDQRTPWNRCYNSGGPHLRAFCPRPDNRMCRNCAELGHAATDGSRRPVSLDIFINRRALNEETMRARVRAGQARYEGTRDTATVPHCKHGCLHGWMHSICTRRTRAVDEASKML